MATTTKTSKPAPKTPAAKPKAVAAGPVKAKAKAAAAPDKPRQAKSVAKKTPAPKASKTPQELPPPRQRPKAAALPAKPPISAEQRRHYIEVAAYFIAERRGFPATSELENWTQAELEIDRLLGEGKLNT